MIGVVLAGKPECREILGDMPLAGHVAEALAGLQEMTGVAVVGPGRWPGAVSVAPGANLVENMRRGLQALDEPGAEVLVAAGDAPLVTAPALARFVAACRGRGAGLGYPIVPRSACEARFPGVRRTYVAMREGRFTGGNCIYLAPAAVGPALARVEAVYEARKQPLRLARLLGVGLVVRLLLGRAAVADAERAATRLLGVPACGIVCAADPELGVDVDRPGDLQWVRATLGDRDQGG